ncbi:MAG: membrane protein insertion efficiency factor YidD [Candidatus Paceibacterota bacterium]
MKSYQRNEFEFNVNPEDEIIIRRQFFGKTNRDIEIEQLEIPSKPIWLKIFVTMIRFYQKRISGKLGNRCVFDPSCSHYSEMAYREKGFINGTKLTVNRLYRCRPENGGKDKLT